MSDVEKYEILSILKQSETASLLDLKKLGPYWKETMDYINELKEEIGDLEVKLSKFECDFWDSVEDGEDNE